MKRSNRLILLIGVFLAVVAFVGIALLLSGGGGGGTGTSGEPPVPTELNTVIATRDIPLGVQVTRDMLKVEVRKIDGERKATAFESVELVIGQVARRAIGEGAQLETADFATGLGVQVAYPPPGFGSIAIATDQVSGVGTVIAAGDYVDLVVGFTGDKFPVVTVNPDDDTIAVVAGLNSTSVKLLIEGVQVIGVLLPPPPTTAEGQPAPTDETTLTGQTAIVILAVTPTQAEIIKFAQLDGSITFVLRSPQDFVDEQGNPIPVVPAGTQGITLRRLVDDFVVPIPELVEAILPEQATP